MATRWRWLAGAGSWKQGSGALGRERARGCGGADEGDAEVAGSPKLRGWLAGVGICEGVAGVEGAHCVLVHKSKKEGHQEMRQ